MSARVSATTDGWQVILNLLETDGIWSVRLGEGDEIIFQNPGCKPEVSDIGTALEFAAAIITLCRHRLPKAES